MLILKTIGILLATLIGMISALFAVASTMSFSSVDPVERRQSRSCAMWSVLAFAICLAAVITLTGCAPYEGAGFTNTGRPRGFTDCVRRDASGNEVWFSVPAGQKCPR